MNRQELLQLNAVPEGKVAWLSYDQHIELRRLFEALPSPTLQTIEGEMAYARMHHFLNDVAQVQVPDDKAAIHFNAFVLIRRGYKVEEISRQEYELLQRLMDGIEQPDEDDMVLHETGSHRALYEYLRREMGLPVQAGRGPAWHRAKRLIEAYEQQNGLK